jgi:hypothetical protein
MKTKAAKLMIKQQIIINEFEDMIINNIIIILEQQNEKLLDETKILKKLQKIPMNIYNKMINYLLEYSLEYEILKKKYASKIINHFNKSEEILDLEKDEYGNNMDDIELIKLLITSKIWNKRFYKFINIFQMCIRTGRLDLVKLCHTYLNLNKNDFFSLWLDVIYSGHKHIIKWLYDIDPLGCTSHFELLFDTSNFELLFNTSYLDTSYLDTSYLELPLQSINRDIIDNYHCNQ